MAKSKTSWKSGQSGNPKGRPPKARALTEMLLAAGKTKMPGPDGKQIERRKLLAEMIWTASTAGEVTFYPASEDGASRVVQFKGSDWFEFIRWLFDQCDGRLSISMRLEEEPAVDPEQAPRPLLYLPENGRDKTE